MLLVQQGYRRCGIVQEGRITDLWVKAVVGDRCHVATRCERLTDKAVEFLGPALPVATVEEDQQRCIGADVIRHVEVEALPQVLAIGEVPLDGVPALGRQRVQHGTAGAGVQAHRPTGPWQGSAAGAANG